MKIQMLPSGITLCHVYGSYKIHITEKHVTCGLVSNLEY